MTGPLARVLAASFGALTSFYLLLSVVPMFVVTGGSDGAAGTVTGLLMFGGVSAELCCTRLTARYGERRVLTAGLILLGTPALLPIAADQFTTVMAVCAVRGFGFGLSVVVTGSLVVGLLPSNRRGEGMGLFGLVTCVPAILALPAGVWLADHVGYPALFVTAAAAALGGLLLQPGRTATAPRKTRGSPTSTVAARNGAAEHPTGLLEGLRRPEQHRLAVVFASTTVAAGIVVAFLPLTGVSSRAAAVGLLAQAGAAAAARFLAGRYGDRRGHTRLLAPGMAAVAAGIAMLVWATNPAAMSVGALLFGAGFGTVQSATLAAMLQRATPAGYGMVNAAWNLAYDLGYGIGPVAFGLLIGYTGYPVAFAATSALTAIALLPAVYHQPRTKRDKTVNRGPSRRTCASPSRRSRPSTGPVFRQRIGPVAGERPN